MDKQKCFEVLELSNNATFDEVKNAYHELVQVWHPDRFINSTKLYERATEKLKIINEAYECLNTHFRREQRLQATQNNENAKYKTEDFTNTSNYSSSDNIFIRQIIQMVNKFIYGGKFDNRFTIIFDKRKGLFVHFIVRPPEKPFGMVIISKNFLLEYDSETRKQKIDLLKSRNWSHNKIGIVLYCQWDIDTYLVKYVFKTLNEIFNISSSQKFSINFENPFE